MLDYIDTAVRLSRRLMEWKYGQEEGRKNFLVVMWVLPLVIWYQAVGLTIDMVKDKWTELLADTKKQPAANRSLKRKLQNASAAILAKWKRQRANMSTKLQTLQKKLKRRQRHSTSSSSTSSSDGSSSGSSLSGGALRSTTRAFASMRAWKWKGVCSPFGKKKSRQIVPVLDTSPAKATTTGLPNHPQHSSIDQSVEPSIRSRSMMKQFKLAIVNKLKISKRQVVPVDLTHDAATMGKTSNANASMALNPEKLLRSPLARMKGLMNSRRPA